MIKVIKPGFYTTLQDLGRIGFEDSGVPISGAMDQYSAKFANALLNNNPNDGVLEITMTGPLLEFQCSTSICITGADMSPMLNGSVIKLNTLHGIQPKDVLTFGKLRFGFRSYLAVAGGFQTEQRLNSRSMFKNITSKVKIESGDNLAISETKSDKSVQYASMKFDSSLFASLVIHVFKGPEFEHFPMKQQQQLFGKIFTISNLNDRMAYQLNEVVTNDLNPIITSPVLPGTVQLTPNGNLIVLMRDCQTTGGYPRILQLTEMGINCLAQKISGSSVRFRLVDEPV